jgi:hypothetical protein
MFSRFEGPKCRLNESRHIEHVLLYMQPAAPVTHAPTRAAFTLV